MTSTSRGAHPYDNEAESFEVTEYPCGAYGALLALGFLVSFVTTLAVLFWVL